MPTMAESIMASILTQECVRAGMDEEKALALILLGEDERMALSLVLTKQACSVSSSNA